MVAGIPEIIESILGSQARAATIEFSDQSFAGATQFHLVSSSQAGTTYEGVVNGREMTGWLCPVFFYYLLLAPKDLYVVISPA